MALSKLRTPTLALVVILLGQTPAHAWMMQFFAPTDYPAGVAQQPLAPQPPAPAPSTK